MMLSDDGQILQMARMSILVALSSSHLGIVNNLLSRRVEYGV